MLRVDILIKVMKNVHLERSIGLHDGDRFLLHKVHLKKKKTNFLKDKCIERMQNIRNIKEYKSMIYDRPVIFKMQR